MVFIYKKLFSELNKTYNMKIKLKLIKKNDINFGMGISH